MYKVIKIFFRTILWVVVGAIVLSLLTGGLLQLPGVQTFAVGRVAGLLSDKLGTRVGVEHVRLKFFSRAQLEGVYVHDLEGDTLLYARRIEAGIHQLGLSGGSVVLGHVELDGTRFYMHQVAPDKSNLEEIIEKLKSDKPKKKRAFALRASSVKISDLHYTYRKLPYMQDDLAEASTRVNFGNLDVRLDELSVAQLGLSRDSLHMHIERIALSERSGLHVEALSVDRFGLSLRGGVLDFSALDLTTPDDRIRMDYLRLVGSSWKDYSDFVNKVRIEAGIVSSTVGFRTIACFAPTLRSWQQRYRNVEGEVAGTVADLRGVMRHVDVLDTHLDNVRFHLSGLPDIGRTRLEIDLPALATNAADALFLMRDITGRELPASSAAMLARLGDISLEGRFEGLLTAFDATAHLQTAQGAARVELRSSGERLLSGTLAADELHLGALLQNPTLGRASLHGRFTGTPGGNPAFDADATITHLAFKGYDYRDIELRGRFAEKMFDGRIVSTDPNMAFDFDGKLDFAQAIPRYDFDMRLHHADLAATHLNTRDSISLLSAHLVGNLSATSLDDANGRLDIADATYHSPADTIRAGDITLLAQNTPQSKSLELRSPFADATFQSRSSYDRLLDYLRRVMSSYLPALSDSLPGRRTAAPTASQAGDYYIVRLQVKQADALANALLPGLVVANGTDIALMLNPTAEQLSLSARSEYLEWKRFFLSEMELTSRNVGDSLAIFVHADELFAGGLYLPDFNLQGGVRDDHLGLQLGYNNTDNQISARFSLDASLSRSPSGLHRIAARIAPSTIVNKQQRWIVSSGDILLDTTRIALERLVIASPSGQLLARGALARAGSDTMHVTMANFHLEPFTQFLESRGIAIGGIANGSADFASPLGAGMLAGDIRLDSLQVNRIALPPLGFTARWDLQNERARMLLVDRMAADTLIRAFWRPTEKRYLADVDLQGVDLRLLDPLLEGVLRNSSGSADVALRLSNPGGAMAFEGEVRIPHLTTTVDFTGVPYTLQDAVVDVSGTNFVLRPTLLRDAQGHTAPFDASFTLAPANYRYALHVRPDNLLVLNTTAADNELFNGHIYASGNATIAGDSHGVRMNIAATTASASSFAMSLSSRGNIADADFVTFVLPPAPPTDSSRFEQRKRTLIGPARSEKAANTSTLALDMTLDVRDNTDFWLVIDPRMGRGIRARGQGNLTLSLDPRTRELRMLGDYALSEGSYNLNLEQLVDRTFTIEPGSMIRWTGNPADALLDVTASYRLKAPLAPLVGNEGPYANTTTDVNCLIRLSERLSKPTIGFDVQLPEASTEAQSLVQGALNSPEMMSTQFLWLVAFNSFYADRSGTQSFGTMSGSATLFNFLSSQLTNMVSSENFNIGLRYRPADNTTSDEFGVNFSWSIAQNRLLLDVEGNYDTENNAARINPNASNLTGDFALRYLVDRTGNVQAKVFSRTIDTYDENQGLQESGIGIYYHEDFNTVGDIVRNMRSRFKRSKKK